MSRKNLLYVVLLILIGIVIYQFYHIIDNKGNVVFYIENEEFLKDQEIDLKLAIDGHVIIDTIFKGDSPTVDLWKSSLSLGNRNVSIGSKTLNIKENMKIFFGPMLWLRIELYRDKCRFENNYYPIVIQ